MFNPSCWLDKYREYKKRRNRDRLEKHRREIEKLQSEIRELEKEERRLRMLSESLEARRELKRRIKDHKEAITRKTRVKRANKTLLLIWRGLFGQPENEQ